MIPTQLVLQLDHESCIPVHEPEIVEHDSCDMVPVDVLLSRRQFLTLDVFKDAD